MTTRGYDLVSPSTRRLFRDLATDIYQRPIEEYWRDEGFGPVDIDPDTDTSVRRRTFDSYATGVDWADHQQVDRALRVFEQMLRFVRRQPGPAEPDFDDLRETLEGDGFRLDTTTCKIHWLRPPGIENSL